MADRFWPLGEGRTVTSPFGQRSGGFHYGADFGRAGGSANMPVFACESGIVKFAGAAQGYGGPDPNGWLVVESGSDCWEYGHIRRLPHVGVGSNVVAGQQIAVVNPDSNTNGGTAPHLHLSWMPGRGYDPTRKADPLPRLSGAKTPGGVVDTSKPGFNEYPVWSPNRESRGGTKIDLFLLHTEEAGGVKDGADRLARWLQGPVNVSYHYALSQDPADGGVTVCDVVDTDYASWSALSANRRSINLVFAGSKASWSRADWLKQSKAIDVAAFLAVQDCKKYGIPIKVLAPPYSSPPPGISDHAYVTKFLKDGTHTDVGPNFPWDAFTECVNKHAGVKQPEKPVVKPVEKDKLALVWEQLVGPEGRGWPQLGGKTLVDAVAELLGRR